MMCSIGYSLALCPSFSITFKEKGQSFLNCSPRTRGQGGRHGLEWAPVTLSASHRAEPRKKR
jgi:hypothetical protein